MAEKTATKRTRGAARKARAERRCMIEGCKNPYRAKGYCDAHYGHWRRGEYGKARYDICSKADCKKPVHKHGLCEAHYKEWWTARHPETAAAAG
ncbi:MAG: hypothetical protein AB2A00_05040 [Myxococcota bacterium]